MDYNHDLKLKRGADAMWARLKLEQAGKGPDLKTGPGCEIHPDAKIHPDARIGANVKIGPNARIGEGARLLDGTTVGAYGEIGKDTVLAKNSTVGVNAKVGDNGFIGEKSVVGAHSRIGEETFVDKNCEIGKECRIDNFAKIGADAKLGQNVELGVATAVGDSTQVGDGVKAGKHCNIGEMADEPHHGVSRREAEDQIKTGVKEYDKENEHRYEGKPPRPTIVDAGTKLDDICGIGQGSYVGRDCDLGFAAKVGRDAKIGDQTRFESRTRVGHDAQVGARTALDEDSVVGCGAKLPRNSTLGKNEVVPNHGNETQVENPTKAAEDKAAEKKAAARLKDYRASTNVVERGINKVATAIANGVMRAGSAIANAARKLTGRTKPEAPRELTGTEQFVANRGNLKRLDGNSSLEKTHGHKIKHHDRQHEVPPYGRGAQPAAERNDRQHEVSAYARGARPAAQQKASELRESGRGKTVPPAATLEDIVARQRTKTPAPPPKSKLQEIVAKHKSKEQQARSDRASTEEITPKKPTAVHTPKQAIAKGAAMTAGHVAGGVAAQTAGATIAGAGNPIAGFAISYAAGSVIEKTVEKGLTGRETSLTETARTGAKKLVKLASNDEKDQAPASRTQQAGTRPGPQAGSNSRGRSGGNDLQHLVKQHQQKKAPAQPKNELEALPAKKRRRTEEAKPATLRDVVARQSPKTPAATPPKSKLQEIVTKHETRKQQDGTDRPSSGGRQSAGGKPATKARATGTSQSRQGGNDLQRLVHRHEQKRAPAAPKRNELQALVAKSRGKAAETSQPKTTTRARARVGTTAPPPVAAPVLAKGAAEKAGQARTNAQER